MAMTVSPLLKDRTSISELSNILYKIKSKNCEKYYVGIRNHHIRDHLREYNYDCQDKHLNKRDNF